jgi:hypothetical protein
MVPGCLAAEMLRDSEEDGTRLGHLGEGAKCGGTQSGGCLWVKEPLLVCLKGGVLNPWIW